MEAGERVSKSHPVQRCMAARTEGMAGAEVWSDVRCVLSVSAATP